MKYYYSVVFDNNGEEKTFSLEKAPKDDPSYVFKDFKIKQLPDPDYKPIRRSKDATQTEIPVKEATISVNDAKTGDLVGRYLPAPNSGKYIIIVPPGSFKLNIEADGFKDYSETFHVVGKGSFEQEIIKNINLVPLKEPEAVHYSLLEKK